MIRRLAAGGAIAALLAIYLLRIDRAAGLFVDDAWYMVLAKSLAEGQGFRIISSATGAFVPGVPPGFPMLLAPIWALVPVFPNNVVALKTVSVLAMAGIGIATYRYLVRDRNASTAMAALIATMTVALPGFVFLATSTVMADVVFALGQLLLLIWIHRVERDHNNSSTVAAALIAVGSWLIRAAGIAGVAASIGFLLWRRRFRSAVIFTAIVAACYLPWLTYGWMNRSQSVARAGHGGSIAFEYQQLLQMRYGGEDSAGEAAIQEVPARVIANLGNVFGRDVGAILIPAIYRGPEESGQEVFGMTGDGGMRASSMGGVAATFWISIALSAVIAIGVIRHVRQRITIAEWFVVLTVAMIALTPARTYRYVLPLVPLLLFYFYSGITALGGSRAVRIAAACLVLLVASEHARYIWLAKIGPAPVWLDEYVDIERLTSWLKEHESDPGHVASNNPGLIYLVTGRRGVSMGRREANWEKWRASGVRYAVAITPVEKPRESLGYRVLYQSPTALRWIVEITASPYTDSMTKTDNPH